MHLDFAGRLAISPGEIVPFQRISLIRQLKSNSSLVRVQRVGRKISWSVFVYVDKGKNPTLSGYRCSDTVR